jgi:hypothetical protein
MKLSYGFKDTFQREKDFLANSVYNYFVKLVYIHTRVYLLKNVFDNNKGDKSRAGQLQH